MPSTSVFSSSRAAVAAVLLTAAVALPARVAGAQTPAPAATAASAAPAIAPIAAGDSASVADVERLLVVADAERAHNRTLEMSLAAQVRANPGMASVAGVMRDFMGRHLSYATLRPDLVRVFRETYTASDVRELTAFYGTPLGRRMVERMPLVAARTNELVTMRMQSRLPELMEAIQAGVRGASPSP